MEKIFFFQMGQPQIEEKCDIQNRIKALEERVQKLERIVNLNATLLVVMGMLRDNDSQSSEEA